MKKVKKCALGLVAITASLAAMTSCDRVTESKDGVIMTFTDNTGARTSYTTEDLLRNYQSSGSSLSSQFDKIFEVLVRHYYETYQENHVGDNGAKMRNLRANATKEVLTVKNNATKNANNNGTSYAEELEKLFDSENVDNIDELFEKKLYEAEKKDFNEQMTRNFGTGDDSINGYEAMRDGYYTKNGEKVTSFPASENWGIGNEGWLKGQMPYHIRHILVKLASGSDKSYTQDKIGDSTNVGETGEASKVANILLHLAGAQFNTTSGVLESVGEGSRLSFGSVARDFSDDNSNTAYGEYGIMRKNTVGSDGALVHEFQLGTYAFETLYSERESAKTDAYRLMPGLQQDATKAPSSVSDVTVIDENQKITVEANKEETVYEFFKDEGVGQIPMGAALALLDTAKTVADDGNVAVNQDSKENFYPRNIIYNKYFNKHNVCVITPNVIATNATPARDVLDKVPADGTQYRYGWLDNASKNASKTALTKLIGLFNKEGGYINNDGDVTEESLSAGEYSSQFGNLPGFGVDTTNIIKGINAGASDAHAHNVLTDSEGNVILAVRAGSGSSYQGIHFITVARSALSEYGYKAVTTSTGDTQYVDYSESEVKTDGNYTVNSASLSDYYTVYAPATGTTSSKYPTYKSTSGQDANLLTYVNYNVNSATEYSTRRDTIQTAITDYLSDLNTYEFQMLFENGNISFASNSKLESDVKNFSQTKRQSTQDDLWQTWTSNWKEYAEMIQAQNAARSYGAGTIKGTLLTELGAIGYANANNSGSYYSSLFTDGGACYYASK